MNSQEPKYVEMTYKYYNYKTYKGYMLNGLRHGRGQYYDKYGNLLYDGIWQYGKLHGKCVCYYSTGMIYYG